MEGKGNDEKVVSREREKCSVCGEETPYYRDTHVDLRLYFSPQGGGQLCKECWERIYPSTC